jgi:hypothetical protein
MGLGSLLTVSLAEARKKARMSAELRADGKDPITEKGRATPIDIYSKPLSLRAIRQLPETATSGVYFLFNGTILNYIGQSSNVFTRVEIHRKAKSIAFDSWRFIPVPISDLDYVEAAYIRAHSPPHNRGIRKRPVIEMVVTEASAGSSRRE